ncbi:hypothetical protein BJP40_19810 [Streptomyces sp. CC53]|uniref:hypothetical protein n=1 Tax=Streptomyces sp. CC53 TaxID=1906740 RepID=UPI0008DDAEAE|nr:hypothetical protein [Streptomyces sp. CC53]OII64588.1 hypothetical protein BJP40_19810 [Streptomyces sp. CC53]
MASIKDRIRAAQDIKVQDGVEIPEWAPEVRFRVRGLPSADWEEYQNKLSKLQLQTGKSSAEMALKSNKALIVAKALYDQDTDERVFPDVAEGVAILGRKNAGIVNGLFNLVRYLSDDDKSFEEKVRDAEGNSDGDQS